MAAFAVEFLGLIGGVINKENYSRSVLLWCSVD